MNLGCPHSVEVGKSKMMGGMKQSVFIMWVVLCSSSKENMPNLYQLKTNEKYIDGFSWFHDIVYINKRKMGENTWKILALGTVLKMKISREVGYRSLQRYFHCMYFVSLTTLRILCSGIYFTVVMWGDKTLNYCL
jgi:hypothetical protein